MPSNSEYIILNGLLWDTEYVIYVVAENQKGKSQSASISFRTSTEPEAIPGTPFPQATPTKLQLKEEKITSQSQTQSSKTTAPPSTFTSSALKGEWQLNRYAMKMHLGGEPEKIFRLNFFPPTSKLWQPFLNELEIVLVQMGQALAVEDKLISSEWL